MKTLQKENRNLFESLSKQQICELFQKYIFVIEEQEGTNYFNCNQFTDLDTAVLKILREGNNAKN
jgi:hypothetical protein